MSDIEKPSNTINDVFWIIGRGHVITIQDNNYKLNQDILIVDNDKIICKAKITGIEISSNHKQVGLKLRNIENLTRDNVKSGMKVIKIEE